MLLEFENITYTVNNWKFKGKISKTSKQILKSISGKFRPGQLTAIMGASGSGKTSLLNALSAYRLTGVDGKFLVGGIERNVRKFHKYSCYISQDDIHQPLLTVREIMTLVASLKLPPSTTEEFKEYVIDEILNHLRMRKNSEMKIENLSSGERKRLSVALELVNNPPIFFLDEPTSGLDQVTSSDCIELLRDVAKQGRTVICTIHQPSASILELFDNVYVMAQGKCVYQGEPLALVPFLSEMGFHCPVHYNPADYVIEVTEDLENIEKLSVAMNNGKLTQSYRNNELSIMNDCDIINLDYSIGSMNTLSIRKQSIDSNVEYETNYFAQFKFLLHRMMLQIGRNRIGIIIQTIHHLLCGIIVGLTFYQKINDAAFVVSSLKYCTGVVLFFTFTQGMAPVLTYPIEVKLVKKEYFNRWYGLPPYYAALTISKLPLQIPLNLLFCAIVYYMAGCPNEFYRFSLFFIVLNIVSFAADGFGLAIGSVFNITNGCIAGPFFLLPMVGLSIYGFDFKNEISLLIKMAMKTSFIRSGFLATVLVVFGLDRKPMDCFDVFCYFQKPKTLLKFTGFDETSLWIEITNTIVLAVFFRAVFYLSLKRRFVWK